MEVAAVNCLQSVEVKGLFPVADGALPAQQEGEEPVNVEDCTGLFPLAKHILRLHIAEGPTATEVEEGNYLQSVEVNLLGLFPVAEGTFQAQQMPEESAKAVELEEGHFRATEDTLVGLFPMAEEPSTAEVA